MNYIPPRKYLVLNTITEKLIKKNVIFRRNIYMNYFIYIHPMKEGSI